MELAASLSVTAYTARCFAKHLRIGCPLRQQKLAPFHTARPNQGIHPVCHIWCLFKLSCVSVAGQVQTHSCNEAHESYEQPTSDAQSRLLSWYWLDEASLLPALMLDPKSGHTVLDMCAAPGGKSLMLASMLFDQQRYAPTAAPAVESSGQPSAQSLTADLDRQGSAANANHTQHSAASASELNLPDGIACSALPPLQEASNGIGNTQQAARAAAALA